MARKTAGGTIQDKTDVKITGTVTGGALNIRKEADITSERVGTLKDGTQIEILEAGKDWHRITEGYVMAKWVKLDA